MPSAKDTQSPPSDRGPVEEVLSRELHVHSETAVKFKIFIREQIEEHPTLTRAYGNCRLKKQVLEKNLFPALTR